MAKRTRKRGSQKPPHTRAATAFVANAKSLVGLLSLIQRDLGYFVTQLRTLDARMSKGKLVTIATLREARSKLREARSTLREVRSRTKETERTLRLIIEWSVVMLVTFTETYLQDVLSDAASLGPDLMADSEQSATYDEVLAARSTDVLAEALRARWARNFVDKGGPTKWIERLGRMGARGYPTGLAPSMEELWGVRHVVVHRAGVVTADFVAHHPSFGAKPGVRISSPIGHIPVWIETVSDFVRPTDAYFVRRFPSLNVERKRRR